MYVCMCSKDEETYLEEMFLIFIPLALKLFISCNTADSNPLSTIQKYTGGGWYFKQH